jgi:secondary thiamine-phosphate synthase enzyme
MLYTEELDLDTTGQELIDLTPAASRFCRALGDGLLTVFVPHATAGVAIFELGAGSETDVLEVLDRVLPHDDRWRHRHGSPGHGADHVLPAIISPSVTIPVVGGTMTLGTWQSIVLVDRNRDNPRRTVRLAFLSS